MDNKKPMKANVKIPIAKLPNISCSPPIKNGAKLAIRYPQPCDMAESFVEIKRVDDF